MTPLTPQNHPDPEALAAFVDGNLRGAELTDLAGHLRSCDECRLIVAETARELRTAAPASSAAPRGKGWMLLAASLAIVATGLFWLSRDRSPVGRLVRAAPHDIRFVEPRLAGGFPWAPLADEKRGGAGADPRQMELSGAAGAVLRETTGDPSPSARHGAGVAHLLSRSPDAAVTELEALASSARDASIWNDLAAARYALAASSGSAEHLGGALAAVDEALRIDAGLKEALFNRALILQQLQLRDAAIEAWRACLAAEPAGGWADEARSRLAMLQRPQATIEEELERSYARLQAGDRDAATALARMDTGEVRRFVQHEALPRWGEAHLANRDDEAERHRGAARLLANAVSEVTSDPSLRETVAVIDAGDARQRRLLARAHVEFQAGRRAFKKRQPIEAERLLASASSAFALSGSAMLHDADVYEAVALFSQNRLPEAEAAFRNLQRTVPTQFVSLRAYLDWQIASCHMTRADWGASIDLLDSVARTLQRLGEVNNAAYVHDILSQVFDRTGDRTLAWQHRIAALRELGRTSNYRLEHVISGLGYDALQREDWRAALSFLQLEATLARTVADPHLQTDALLRRALAGARLGATATVAGDLRDAAAIVDSVRDPAMRERLRADQMAVAAMISEEPRTAIPLLTAALEFHSTKGWRMLMPDLYLHRGRMHRQAGDESRAIADFEHGIAELEGERTSLPAGEPRWGILDAAESLREEAIASSLPAQPVRALEFAERLRARTLADSLDRPIFPLDFSTLPKDLLLVEYAALSTRLVIFVAGAEGCTAWESPIGRNDLQQLISRLQKELVSGRDTADARKAWEALVAPIASVITGHSRLVIVADATTSAVPFAALVDPAGRRMVEHHIISLAPSAGSFLQNVAETRTRPLRTLLMVDNPVNDRMPPLPSSREEADAILSAYGSAKRLSGLDATSAAFFAHAPSAGVIHFAGHAITTDTASALLLSASGRDAGMLDAGAISRLRLTASPIVVLAACGSARGPVRAEGVMSVAYAFLHAGAPTVIATLWAIPDREAAAFFPRLHQQLARGTPPAEAVRLTQIEFMRTRPEQSGLWAAVQSIGTRL